MFEDRKDAGEKLAGALKKYKDKNMLVLAIPKGGVEVAFQVAKALNADFSLLVVRKLPFPFNPEAGFGAIAEDGSTFIFKEAAGEFTKSEVDAVINEQKREVLRRIKTLRQGQPLPDMTGRAVILVDDGLAMGSTMRAAIKLCRNQKAGKIIAAVPVSGTRTAREIEKIADETVILEKPPFFRAVAEVYKNWYDVSDEEVLEIMKGLEFE